MTWPNNNKTSVINHTTSPWYREPWAWFIAAIVAISMCWGVFVLYISAHFADTVVIDDYYKVGKAINRDLRRDQTATNLNLHAVVFIDESGVVQVDMSGTATEWPQQLRLQLQSTRPNREAMVIALVQNAPELGQYQGIVAQLPSDYYHIQLETLTDNNQQPNPSHWRIYKNKTLFNQNTPVILTADNKS